MDYLDEVPPAEGPVSGRATEPLSPESSGHGTAPRRRHLQHRPVTGRDVAVVGALAVGAAVLAAFASDAAPTATGWIDAVERAAAAGVVTLAASRARRWTLILGSVLATVASPWPQLLVGAAALFTGAVMVEKRRRSRVTGAAIGAVVAVLSLRLETPGPLGTESLIALAATVPILASGYQRASLGARRVTRRTIAVAIAFTVLATGLAALGAALSVGDLTDAVEATQTAVDLAGEGTGDEPAAAFEAANDHFRSADAMVGSLWATGARAVPVVGANLGAAQRAVEAGIDLTGAGESLVAGAEFETVQLPDGGVDLAVLDSFAPRVDTAAGALDAATAAMAASESEWLLPPLRQRLEEVQDRLDSISATSDNAVVALDGLPALLGADGPRRYVFLLGNPAESRDLGGHIGNWAEVVADRGRIQLIEVGGPLDLSMPELSEGFAETYPRSYSSLDPARSPQNLGATADLGVAGPATAELFEAATGRTVDGVAYADVGGFAALAELVGGVTVQTPGGPVVLDGENSVEFLTRGQYEVFDSTEEAGDALDAAVEELFEKLTTTKLAGPQTLGETFAPLVAEGRFQLWSRHGDDAPMLQHFGLEGLFPEPGGGDVLGVFNRNAGPNKIDSYLERDVAARVLWDPTTGAVGSTVTVDLQNTAPEGMTNEIIGGGSNPVALGTNLTSLVLTSPHRLRAVTVDGVDTVPQPLKEGDMWRYEVRVAVPPQESVSVQYDLTGRVEAGPDYRLLWVGQPLVHDGPLEVRIDPVRGEIGACEVTSRTSADGCSDDLEAFRGSQAADTAILWSAEDR